MMQFSLLQTPSLQYPPQHSDGIAQPSPSEVQLETHQLFMQLPLQHSELFMHTKPSSRQPSLSVHVAPRNPLLVQCPLQQSESLEHETQLGGV
jgi:hypothetical protein